jgi:intein/homing endonuclease
VGVTVGDKVNVWVTTGDVKVGDKIASIGSGGNEVIVGCWLIFRSLLFKNIIKPKQ